MSKGKELIIKPIGNITYKHIGMCDDEVEKIKKLALNVVIIDFSSVGFVDSTAIACLVKISKICKDNNVFFAVLRCHKTVKNLLYNLKLNLQFPID